MVVFNWWMREEWEWQHGIWRQILLLTIFEGGAT